MFEQYGEFLIKERVWTNKDRKSSNRIFRFDNGYGVQVLEWPEAPDEFEVKILEFGIRDEDYKEIEVEGMDFKDLLLDDQWVENVIEDVMRF